MESTLPVVMHRTGSRRVAICWQSAQFLLETAPGNVLWLLVLPPPLLLRESPTD